MEKRGAAMTDALADGARLFLSTIERIERGEFPPRPTDVIRCEFCNYPAVCRKDYADEA
jgi:hypothetical protein